MPESVGNTKGDHNRMAMTPLWVVSLFVSLAEVVAGLALTQASGGVQIALTAFVIGFPLLVAAAFFTILWSRPYVFYPPSDFADGVDVNAYVRAMGNKVDVVRADVEAEASNLRAALVLESQVATHRIEALETRLADLFSTGSEAPSRSNVRRESAGLRTSVLDKERESFEQNSRFRVNVVSVTPDAPSRAETDRVKRLAASLQKVGFRTSTSGWGSHFYLKTWNDSGEPDTAIIIHRAESSDLLRRLEPLVRDVLPGIPVTAMSVEQAVSQSENADGMEVMGKRVDAVVAYCIRPGGAKAGKDH